MNDAEQQGPTMDNPVRAYLEALEPDINARVGALMRKKKGQQANALIRAWDLVNEHLLGEEPE